MIFINSTCVLCNYARNLSDYLNIKLPLGTFSHFNATVVDTHVPNKYSVKRSEKRSIDTRGMRVESRLSDGETASCNYSK